MAATKDTSKPISDLMYDWLTVLQNKAQALAAYDKYLHDAESENATECVTMLKKLRDEEAHTLDEVKHHVFGMIAKSCGKC